jgi:photosystem II stability/assembly factor-like uncharacterized protein
MSNHCTNRYFILGSLIFFMLIGSCFAPLWAQRRVGEAIPTNWQDDAELTDVTFADPLHGWTVGEHGTLLRTVDGGNTWEHCSTMVAMSAEQGQVTPDMQRMLNSIRKNTGTQDTAPRQTIRQSLDVRLESVSFADTQFGVAVGGHFSPGTEISRGVVFTTKDGGANWETVSGAILPKLNQVEFETGVAGWAVGNQSYLLGTGLVTTTDGGRNWFSDPNVIPGNWRSACKTSTGWVLLNHRGDILVAQGNRLEGSVRIGTSSGRVNQILMIDDRNGWAVGDQGTFLQTRDGGHSWRSDVAEVDQVRLRSFDLQALSLQGNQIWIAGNPGTFVFKYEPSTRKLTAARTPTRCRINSLQMVDEQTGCAVGTWGTILQTNDGGLNWKLTRGGSTEPAVLAISFLTNNLPLEALGRAALGDGYQAAVARITFDSANDNSECLTQAASRLGVNEVRTIDLELGKRIFDESQRMNLLVRLVKAIRELEPRLIVVDSAQIVLPNGSQLDTFSLMDEAIRMAGDERILADQLTATGLVQWRVDRLAIPTEFDDGQWRVDRNSLLTRTGKRLDDEIAISRALIGLPISITGVVNYRVKDFSTHNAQFQSNIMTGLSETGQPVPRRRDAKLGSRNLREMGHTLDKNKAIKQICSLPLVTMGDKILWEQNVRNWLQDVDRETAGIWIAQLSETYYAKGDLSGAALAVDYLLTQYADHPLGTLSLATLAGLVASREVQITMLADSTHSRELNETIRAAAPPSQEVTVQDFKQGPVQTTVWTPTPHRPEVASPPESTVASLTAFHEAASTRAPIDAKVMWANAVQQFVRLRQRDPELANHPSMRALEAHVIRYGDSWPKAANLFKQLSLSPMADDGMKHWAAMETKLQTENTGDSLSAVACQPIDSRPRLDGELNDEAWRQVFSSRTICPTGLAPDAPLDKSDQVILAYDEEFLFLAIRCQKIDGILYPEPTRGRTRNPNLEMFDRVELAFDVDGDQAWPLRLTIDARGWAADHCGNSPAWDPDWFVAAKHSPTHWTIEAAIPWSALGDSPKPGTHWGLGMARRLPRKNDNLWQLPSPPTRHTLLAVPTFANDRLQPLRFK